MSAKIRVQQQALPLSRKTKSGLYKTEVWFFSEEKNPIYLGADSTEILEESEKKKAAFNSALFHHYEDPDAHIPQW